MSFKVQNKVLNTEVPQPLVSKKEEVLVPKQNNSTKTEQKFVADNNLNEGLAGKTGFDYSTLRRNSLETTFLTNNQNKEERLPKTLVFTPQELGIVTNGKKLPNKIKVGEQQFEQKLFESYGLDINNPNDKAIIQKVYGNDKEPADNLDWTINGKTVKELTVTLRSDGNYEATVDLRKETNDRLGNAFFNKLFFPNQANIFDFSSTQNLSANTRNGEFQKTADDVNLTDLALDMTQMGLDIVGIFEPTPFADLTNAGISAVRGEWGNAALSVLGVIPYLGDLGKFGKIPKWLSSIEKLTTAVGKLAEVAIKGGKKGKEVAEAFIKQVKDLLDKIPFDKVPGAIKDALGKLKQKVDDFFSKKTPDIEPPKKPKLNEPPKINKVEVDGVMLPATTKESVENKLWTYLLDENHIQGGPKAKWFKEALGFTKDNMYDLAKQIVFDPAKAVKTADTSHGQKFNQVITIIGANGKKIDVNFGWIKNNDGIVRLTTGIPAKK